MPSPSAASPQDASPSRAVFLDRDGTCNVEKHYLHRKEDWEWIPGAPEALVRLKTAGFLLVVVSNQSGIGRGYYDRAAVDALHEFVNQELRQRGAAIDAFYLCPHAPDSPAEECGCRKPAPGMLLRAAKELNIDLAASWMVGDKAVDVAAALAAGCRPVLVRTGYGEKERHAVPPQTPVVADLAAAVDLVLSRAG